MADENTQSEGFKKEIMPLAQDEKHDPRVPEGDSKTKVEVPVPATDDAVSTNPKDSNVAPVSPPKRKTPGEMDAAPEDALNPPDAPTDPEKNSQPGQGVNQKVADEMGADKSLTEALGETFKEYLYGGKKTMEKIDTSKHMSAYSRRLAGTVAKSGEMVIKQASAAECEESDISPSTPFWWESEKDSGFWSQKYFSSRGEAMNDAQRYQKKQP